MVYNHCKYTQYCIVGRIQLDSFDAVKHVYGELLNALKLGLAINTLNEDGANLLTLTEGLVYPSGWMVTHPGILTGLVVP